MAIADFHVAGRHTHITRLLLSGFKLVEANRLARHSAVRMTMKYTYVGLKNPAKAVYPPADKATGKCRHYVSTKGGALG